MLVHGVAPACSLLSIMIPILKSKRGQKCSSDNYRAIALSSLIGKILDTIEAVGLFRSLMQIRSQHLSTIYKHNLS